MASYKWKTPRSTSRGTRPPDTDLQVSEGPDGSRRKNENRDSATRSAIANPESKRRREATRR